MILIPCCITALIGLTFQHVANAQLSSLEEGLGFRLPLERFYEGTFQDPLPSANELTNEEKQRAIKEAFQFAWQGYRTYSWGFDENRPVTNTPLTSRNGWGVTIVDSLDTLYIMGLMDEFKEAREFVAAIDWGSTNDNVHVFETTIRYVGGLLSAYELSHDYMFAAKAADLVERLLPAFTESPTGIPYQYVDFHTGHAVKSNWEEGASALAELGAVQIEFTRLSQITGDWKYHDIGQRVYDTLLNTTTSYEGLYPHLINPDTGKSVGDYLTWGGMADSFYEYLIKQYIFSNSKDTQKKQMMIDAVNGLRNYMLQSPKNHDDMMFISSRQHGVDLPVMDELACFAPSALLLSAYWIDELADVQADAKRLLKGCYSSWASTRTGIAPEVFGWISQDGNAIGEVTQHKELLAKQFGVFDFDAGYVLRPETLESVFYFYQFDQDKNYQDIAWDIFNSLHTYCRANSGFSGLDNVETFTPKWDDRQESYMFAETFKYLYLMFDDPSQPARFPLDQWVFNTEGHPLRIVDINPLVSSRFAAPPPTPGLTISRAAQPVSTDVWSWLGKTFGATAEAVNGLFT
ncbi:glycoside hydrolase [Chlamydoabsidia padenii]|nr:glycoside hydrolase [Chlamydoabsidia padenii]